MAPPDTPKFDVLLFVTKVQLGVFALVYFIDEMNYSYHLLAKYEIAVNFCNTFLDCLFVGGELWSHKNGKF